MSGYVVIVEYNLSTGHTEVLATIPEEEAGSYILVHVSDDKTSDHVIYVSSDVAAVTDTSE